MTTAGSLLAILIAITALGPLALNIFIPSMPGIQRVFDTDYASVQLTLTLYLASTAVAQLFLGSLSDRFGRRPVLLSGQAIFLIGSLAAVLAVSIDQLIASRVVQAVGGCAGMVLGRAIVRDLYDAETAASRIAYITMAMVVAPMVAPAIGGYFDVWFGWRASFVLVAGCGALVLLATFWHLPETHRQRGPRRGFGALLEDYAALLCTRRFLGYSGCLAFTSALFFSFLAGAPYITVELMRQPPSVYGLYFVLISLGYMGGNFLSGRLSRRLGIDRMLPYGTLLALLGVGLLIGLAAAGILVPAAVFGPMAVIALANGLVIPNATAGAVSVDPQRIGTASGLAGFVQIAVGALATWVVGLLQDADATQWPMIYTMAASWCIACLSLLLVLRSRRL